MDLFQRTASRSRRQESLGGNCSTSFESNCAEGSRRMDVTTNRNMKMRQAYGFFSSTFTISSVKFSLVHLLAAFQIVTDAVPAQQRYFINILSPANGRLCIQDTPSVTVKVNSLAQCAGGCVTFQNCSGFNIFDGETLVNVDCQLFKTGNSMQLATRPGCRGYQVSISGLHHDVR
jgi:hypothetical protein